jgi:5-methyltetrahydropteroyltriglutamate--homocysteine methyltransferase
VQTSSDRILTTHAGSLPRPEELTALHVRRAAGEAIGEAEFDTAVEEATRDVIAAQLEAGLDIVNNGEAGRESFFTYVQHRMTGFGEASNRPIMADLTRYPGYLKQLAERSAGTESINLLTAPKAVGEVRYAGSPAIEAECAQLQRLLEPHRGRFGEAFVSSPSPGIVAAAMENAYYDDLESYVAALAAALRTEYQVIVQAGFVLQIDAPDLAMERHTLFQDKPLSDFLDFVRVVVAAINDALGGLARERVRLHVCWGNYEAAHDLDVPLADIWPEISRVHAGGFLLSMANPRHAHEYHLFDKGSLPRDALLVPGVVDTTTNYVEHPEAVADRIELAARAVGDQRQIIAGTDCGFETAAGFVSVAPDIAWAKLRALSEGAALASKRLLG